MAPELAVAFYVAAIVLFVLAGLGVSGLRRPYALGWFGVALVTAVLMADVLDAL